MTTSISRRSLAKAGAASLALSAIPLPRWLAEDANAGVPLIRYNAYSSEGKAMLAQYAQAVGIMKQRSLGDPCSWIFQWFTHWVRSDSTKSAQIAGLPAAQQPLATDMWNTCQNHGGFTTEDMFLPWHRMYVLYFERIVRRALNDPTWTLPYWSYTTSGQGSLPQEFINPGNNANALWVANRNPGPNSGAPLSGLNLDALKQPDYSGFCSTLDFGLHGNVHVEVGNTQNMGAVPWAANDPIFWMHHCNIDRLWASWNAGGYSNPTSPAWTNQTFIFADECCGRIVAKVGDVTAMVPLHYTYDHLEPVNQRRFNWPLFRLALEQRPPILPGPGPVELGPQRVNVQLRPARGARAFSLREQLRGLQSEERLYLIVGDLMTNGAPGSLFDIFLNLPAGRSANSSDPNFVGSINFFAADMPPGSRPMREMPGLVFDVTDTLGQLDRTGGAGGLTVTIIPRNRINAETKPVVGRLSLLKQ